MVKFLLQDLFSFKVWIENGWHIEEFSCIFKKIMLVIKIFNSNINIAIQYTITLEFKEIEMSQHEMLSSYQNKLEYWNNAFLLSAFENVIEITTFSQKIWISLSTWEVYAVCSPSGETAERQKERVSWAVQIYTGIRESRQVLCGCASGCSFTRTCLEGSAGSSEHCDVSNFFLYE